MKISKMCLAVWSAFCSMAKAEHGKFGTLGGVVRLGNQSGGQMPPEFPIESIAMLPYNIAAAVTLTDKQHSGRTGRFNIAAGVTATLPRAVGSGAKFRFTVGITVTSVGDKIVCANTDDSMRGIVYSTLVGTPTTNNGWPATAASAYDTITLNGTTTGGIIGDWIEVEDIATAIWQVSGCIQQSDTAATVFTAAV